MNVKVVALYRPSLPLRPNWVALVEINEEAYTAIRHGGFGIWDFPGRSKFGPQDLDYFDETCNEELRREGGV